MVILVVEANCISNLNPNHIPYNRTPSNICERVTATTLQKYDAFDVFSGYYICKIMRWLLDALWCDPFTDVQCMHGY